MKKLFIFMGSPGSGKGSLSALCVKELGWLQLSTGDLCRKHIFDKTEIGKKIDFAIKSGKLISDGLIISMVEKWLCEQRSDDRIVIIDGYPRSITQVEGFSRFMASELPDTKVYVVRFEIDRDRVIDRLKNRLICSDKQCQAVYSSSSSAQGVAPARSMICDECGSGLTRRSDDQIASIEQRLNTYDKTAGPIFDLYEKLQYPIIDLQVDAPLGEIFETFKNNVVNKAV